VNERIGIRNIAQYWY